MIQPSFEADWDYWNALQSDRPRYEAEKERIAGEVLHRLEAHYPGLSAQVEMTDVATPYTTWRYTRNWRGAYEGWLPTGPQLMTDAAAYAARSAELRHGGAVGGARRRRADLPDLRARCDQDSVSAGWQSVCSGVKGQFARFVVTKVAFYRHDM